MNENELDEYLIPTITIDNVRCKISGIPNSMANLIAKELSVKVPNYWFSAKFKSGYWDGTQKFFNRPGNTFPTGLLPIVVDLLQTNWDIEPVIEDRRKSVNEYDLNPIHYGYNISDCKVARDYQVETLNNLINNKVCGIRFTRGVVNIATNGGKTAIAISFIKELYKKLVDNNTTFLFITHSKEIAKQAKKSIEDDLDVDVGFIGDGKWDVKHVTVAIVTTLYRRINKDEFHNLVNKTIGFVADECHHSSSTSWYDVFSKFTNASIRIGLTGTVDDTNPVNEMRLYSCTGQIINRISNDFLIENGFSAKPICIFFAVTTPELEGESYSDAYNMGVVDNNERLEYIVQICKKETDSSNVVLILVEHIEHGEIIKNELDALGRRVFFTNGTLDTNVRQELLNGLKNGEVDILISTSILDEGVDVSNINAIIYARGMKSSRKLLQGIGRGLRKKEDDSKLRFYDFIDDTHSALLSHSMSRYKVLKNEKFNIKLLSIDEYQNMTWEEIEHE